MTTTQCAQYIPTNRGIRPCGRKATHTISNHITKGVCTQHARPSDIPRGR